MSDKPEDIIQLLNHLSNFTCSGKDCTKCLYKDIDLICDILLTKSYPN